MQCQLMVFWGEIFLWNNTKILCTDRALQVITNHKKGISYEIPFTEELVTPEVDTQVQESQNFPIIKIPPRTEMLIELPTHLDQNEVVCYAQEIKEGIFISNSISTVSKNKIKLSVLNSNQEEVVLPEFKPQIEILENYTVYTLEKNKNIDTKRENMKNRWEKLRNQIILDESHNHEEIREIKKLCREYQDIFHLEEEKLSYTDIITHKINMKHDQTPINQRPYRLPEAHKAEIEKQVKGMLDDEIIIPSKSPWNSPLLVVPKKAGPDGEKRWRIVIDFRKLNECTIGDAFPLPNIEAILDQLGKSRYFSTLDLASGYHQIKMDPKDREKTAFSTAYGHYEFLRMPFGLKTAPATFQRAMNLALTGLQGLRCFTYLDDLVVYGRNLNDHCFKLREVFDRLREHNLKLQPLKCKFLRKEVVYLGHKCSVEGCLPDPDKVACVQNFPKPKNIKQLQSFLGLANYYRKFIVGFSAKAEPLNKLLRGDKIFEWNDDCEKSFQALKMALITPPLLIYPDFSKPFTLTTDASSEAIGAVLSQGEEDKPIAYASRTLNSAERRYSTIERELLAIVWAVNNFRCYLFGRKFVVYTDHQPLKGVFNVKNPTSRLVRFHHKLSEYDYEIKYKPGRKNQNADTLSRIPTNDVLVTTRAQKKKDLENQNDKVIKTNENLETDSDSENEENLGEKRKNYIKIKDPKEIKEVLKAFHDNPLGGHQGVMKTYERIKQQYRWKGMVSDITKYINKCTQCQKNKHSLPLKMPMVITDTAEKPFDKVYIDLVGPLPKTNKGNKYILTFQDNLTRFMDCYAIPDGESSTVAKVFYEEIITRYRLPKILVTDQGTTFMSELFTQVCKFLKIKKISTTAYHPQSNGALERCHKPLAEYLRSFTKDKPDTWDEWLHVHNNTKHASTKLTPMDCLFGFTAELPTNLNQNPLPIYDHENYFHILRYKIQKTHMIARENLIDRKMRNK